MSKIYKFFIWLIMILLTIEVICVCVNWIVASLIISIILLIFVIVASVIYIGYVKHMCPKCGMVFKGRKLEMIFAPHTPTKRRMTCPNCNEKLWCDDCFEGKNKNDKNA